MPGLETIDDLTDQIEAASEEISGEADQLSEMLDILGNSIQELNDSIEDTSGRSEQTVQALGSILDSFEASLREVTEASQNRFQVLQQRERLSMATINRAIESILI